MAHTPEDPLAEWLEPFGRMLEWPEFFQLLVPSHGGYADTIRVEELLQDGALTIVAELPGIDPERDIELTVSGGMLRLRAERRPRRRREDGRPYRAEIRYGIFQRVLPLPPGADEESIRASYRDGMLEITVPVDHHKAGAARIRVHKA